VVNVCGSFVIGNMLNSVGYILGVPVANYILSKINIFMSAW
jgi:hypothetical protein